MSSPEDHRGGGPDTIPDNPNQHISTMGMITTLLINIGVFVLVQWIFEVNRFYKQIYLKRLQKRFEEIGRVPPIPPHHVFGWLKALYDVSEMDVLRMVGLDAYMLLRYHVVCWKLSLFMSFWGIVALTPIYSTATNNIFETGTLQWDHYTLRNVVNGASETKYRLWAAAVFGYIFAAYFMQVIPLGCASYTYALSKDLSLRCVFHDVAAVRRVQQLLGAAFAVPRAGKYLIIVTHWPSVPLVTHLYIPWPCPSCRPTPTVRRATPTLPRRSTSPSWWRTFPAISAPQVIIHSLNHSLTHSLTLTQYRSTHPLIFVYIPDHLLSAAALYKFFEKLFPGEVSE